MKKKIMEMSKFGLFLFSEAISFIGIFLFTLFMFSWEFFKSYSNENINVKEKIYHNSIIEYIPGHFIPLFPSDGEYLGYYVALWILSFILGLVILYYLLSARGNWIRKKEQRDREEQNEMNYKEWRDRFVKSYGEPTWEFKNDNLKIFVSEKNSIIMFNDDVHKFKDIVRYQYTRDQFESVTNVPGEFSTLGMIGGMALANFAGGSKTTKTDEMLGAYAGGTLLGTQSSSYSYTTNVYTLHVLLNDLSCPMVSYEVGFHDSLVEICSVLDIIINRNNQIS